MRVSVCLFVNTVIHNFIYHCLIAREKLITLSSLQTLEVANSQLTNKVSYIVMCSIAWCVCTGEEFRVRVKEKSEIVRGS